MKNYSERRALPELRQVPLFFISSLIFAFGFMLTYMTTQDDKYLLVVFGFLCPAATMLPFVFLQKRICLHEPISLLMFTMLVSTVGRSLYMTYSSESRAEFLLFEQTISQVIAGAWIVPLSLFILATAYCLTISRTAIEKWSFLKRRVIVNPKNCVIFSILFVTMSVAAGYMVTKNFGITFGSLDTLSSKRPGKIDLDSGDIAYTSNGALRLIGSMCQFVMYLILAFHYSTRRTLNHFFIGLLVVLFVANSIVPFLTSSRFAIIAVVVNLFIIFITFYKIQVRKVIGAGLVIVTIIYGMGELRHLNQTGNYTEQRVVASVFGSGNFLDVARTTAIIDRVSSNQFLYGQSYLAFITAPIPKTVWPEKPNPSYGPWVKSEVFGYAVRNHGWPPGFISEAYFNFGFFGIFTISALFGIVLKHFSNTFLPLLRRNAIAMTIYSAMLWPFSVGTFGLNFAQGMMQALMSIVPMVLVVFVFSRR